MAESVFSYSDIIRSAAKHLAYTPNDLKQTLQQVARVYTAVSKHLNYQLRKFLA